ncbi:MAG: glycosyltransferase family 4 protein [Flavobacteriaceae bacterium]|nr:glycosyltransferase family 4 protein [Flavobacteriaceae bacterium]
MKTKIIRTSTIAMSLNLLLKGQLSFLLKHYDVIAVSGYDDDLELVKNREKVAVKDIKMERQIAPFQDLISLYKLYKFFKKEKPTIVHSITPKAGLLTMMAAKYAGVPLRIHTFTGLIFPSKKGFFQKLLIAMDKVLCWHATHIFPEGNGVKQDLEKYKITSKPLKIIANGNVNGIDVDYFNVENVTIEEKQKLKNELNILSEDFVFIFVGRLVGDKGINELVRAFSKLQTPNSKLLLVGPLENNLDPLLPETLKEINYNPNIISVGYQTDVRKYYAISNVLVFPSYREGFPNVVLQAGAMQLPSIVTNINGSNEIIKHNKNGLIIPVQNSDAIFVAMLTIMNQVDINDMKKQARIMIENRYKQELVWEALLKEYKELEKSVL